MRSAVMFAGFAGGAGSGIAVAAGVNSAGIASAAASASGAASAIVAEGGGTTAAGVAAGCGGRDAAAPEAGAITFPARVPSTEQRHTAHRVSPRPGHVGSRS
jgi:hypothetical protein